MSRETLLKNILKVFLGYIIVTAAIIALLFFSYIFLWIFAHVVTPVFYALHLITGYKLKDSENRKDKLMPVFFLWAALLVIWAASFTASIMTGGGDRYMTFYYLLNPIILSIQVIFDSIPVLESILSALSSAIPPLIIWMGIKLKEKRQKLTDTTETKAKES
ncbi:MAG TPA: hypothetical protein GX501_05300 [Clostridiaceae bacterium]|nr:hypothetical protein [Clostridiaceae bacterium]